MTSRNKTTTVRLPQNRPPVHPGEILSEEYILPLDLTQHEMAFDIWYALRHPSKELKEIRPLKLV